MPIPARPEQAVLSDEEIYAARAKASGILYKAMIISLPIGAFIIAPAFYARMLGDAARLGRRPIVTFPVVALFCLVHYAAMAGTLLTAFLSGQGALSPFLASGAGLALALAYLTLVHPRMDWLDV